MSAIGQCLLLTQSGHIAQRHFDHFQPARLTRYDAFLWPRGAMRRRELGLTVLPSLIARTDDVIE
jgi:hypothetical protein